MTNIEKASVCEGSFQWKVMFLPAASKQYEKLDKAVCRKINKYIKERLATSGDPRRFGKALSYDLKEFWRYRIGDYRLICKIEDEKVLILVVRVDHHKETYE